MISVTPTFVPEYVTRKQEVHNRECIGREPTRERDGEQQPCLEINQPRSAVGGDGRNSRTSFSKDVNESPL